MRFVKVALTCTVAAFCLSGIALGAPRLGTGAVLRLYGSTAKLTGAIKSEVGYGWLAATGEATASWRIAVRDSHKYRVDIVYSVSGAGAHYRLSIGSHVYKGDLPPHAGIFPDPRMNFARMQVVASAPISAGPQTVSVRLYGTGPQVRLRLIKIEAVGRERAEDALALRSRANTSWLADSGYGVMFHWTDQTQPRRGPAKSYVQAVADFNVTKFAQMVARTGASYVVFTVDHADPTCPAPIHAWARYHRGWTTKRDLIGDIARALAKRDIRLILYINSGTLGGLYKSTAAKYLRIHEAVLTELGRRYGRLIAGYWFDDWYQTMQAYPSISPRELLPYVRMGNPSRLVAYNFWIYPVETKWEDYWAGEVADIVKPATSRFLPWGWGYGVQDHNLLYLDAPWLHSTPNSPMEKPRFSDHALIGYVSAMHAHHAAVTLNVGIFQNGTIGKATMSQLIALRSAIWGSMAQVIAHRKAVWAER